MENNTVAIAIKELRQSVEHVMRAAKSADDQPRDENGRFASSGGGGGKGSESELRHKMKPGEVNGGHPIVSAQDKAHLEHTDGGKYHTFIGATPNPLGRKDRSGLDQIHVGFGKQFAIDHYNDNFVNPKGSLSKQAIAHAQRWAQENNMPVIDAEHTHRKGQEAEKQKKEKEKKDRQDYLDAIKERKFKGKDVSVTVGDTKVTVTPTGKRIDEMNEVRLKLSGPGSEGLAKIHDGKYLTHQLPGFVREALHKEGKLIPLAEEKPQRKK